MFKFFELDKFNILIIKGKLKMAFRITFNKIKLLQKNLNIEYQEIALNKIRLFPFGIIWN